MAHLERTQYGGPGDLEAPSHWWCSTYRYGSQRRILPDLEADRTRELHRQHELVGFDVEAVLSQTSLLRNVCTV